MTGETNTPRPATAAPTGGLFALPVDEFLERVAAREPAPGGGAVAGATVAAAAGLVAMAARFSEGDTAAAADRADALRQHACALAEEDGSRYAAVLAAYQLPRDPAGPRRERIVAALADATDIPLALVECARDVGTLGVAVAAGGNPNLRGDAITAVLLADAAGRSAAHLVRCNVDLGQLPGDPVERSQAWCDELGLAVRAVEGRA